MGRLMLLPLLAFLAYALVLNLLSSPAVQTISYRPVARSDGEVVAIGDSLTVEVIRHRDLVLLPDWIYLYLPAEFTWKWQEVNVRLVNYVVLILFISSEVVILLKERGAEDGLAY